MCTQRPPNDFSQVLYDRYGTSFAEYMKNSVRKFLLHFLTVFSLVCGFVGKLQVLPALKEQHGEFMLHELVKRWDNHKLMVRYISNYFAYLDKYFTNRKGLPGLKEVGLSKFRELVSMKYKFYTLKLCCWWFRLFRHAIISFAFSNPKFSVDSRLKGKLCFIELSKCCFNFSGL